MREDEEDERVRVRRGWRCRAGRGPDVGRCMLLRTWRERRRRSLHRRAVLHAGPTLSDPGNWGSELILNEVVSRFGGGSVEISRRALPGWRWKENTRYGGRASEWHKMLCHTIHTTGPLACQLFGAFDDPGPPRRGAFQNRVQVRVARALNRLAPRLLSPNPARDPAQIRARRPVDNPQDSPQTAFTFPRGRSLRAAVGGA